MFTMLVGKVYMVNRGSKAPLDYYDITYYNLDSYEKALEQYESIDGFYRYLLTLNGRKNGLRVLIVNDNDFNKIIRDYLVSLRLGYEEYKLIKAHSDYCTLFCDFCAETISKHDDDMPELTSADFDIELLRTKLKSEDFPAEFSVNCLDQPWAKHKFYFFRAYDIYNHILKVQEHKYQETGEWWFQEFCGGDHTAKMLIEQGEKYYEVIGRLKEAGLNTSEMEMPIEEWAKHTINAGYTGNDMFKYNPHLANRIRETGYRIDR